MSKFGKKRKLVEMQEAEALLTKESKYFIQLVNGDEQQQSAGSTLAVTTGPTCEIDSTCTKEQLNQLLNQLLLSTDESNGSNGAVIEYPYSFYVDGKEEITASIRETLLRNSDELLQRKQISSQDAPLKIVYYPQAMFKVRPVTRCSATLSGHSEAVLGVQFSPDGTSLATASGDATVRLWDLNTETPQYTLKGHTNWVLTVAWSPDAKKVASGGKDNLIKVWWAENGEPCSSKPLRGHKKWITSLAWEPYHLNPKCQRLASSSKDESIMVWDVSTARLEFTLSGHTKGVTSVKWGGDGNIYSCSQDCTIRVWSTVTKTTIKVLSGHAHWVNTMTMSTDYVLRRGMFDYNCEPVTCSEEDAVEAARKRYEEVVKGRPLRIITGSDDNTLCLWEPQNSDKPVARLTGHQAVVNSVCFSPDGRLIASASFDKSVKIWEASTGKFLGNLRGHVGAVYQVCWSADSRLLVSASKDSTAKVWDIQNKRVLFDLPGHHDEVYAIDWAPDGQRVASGGKDRVLKIWRN